MMHGYFGSRLNDAERERVQRPADDFARDSSALSGDAQHADTARRLAARDVGALQELLRTAWQRNQPEVYERLKSSIVPTLTRRIAVANGGGSSVPFDQALGDAQPKAGEIVRGIEAPAHGRELPCLCRGPRDSA